MDNFLAHILVVDDDEGIRSLVKKYLNEKKYLVTTADTAENASEKIKVIKFDLIILDIMMPGKSGLDFLKEHKEYIDTPIILLTAKGEPNERIEGLEVGADDYLPKPFEPKELDLRIKNIINKTKKNVSKKIIKFANVKERFTGKKTNLSNIMTYMNQQFDPSVTWEEAKEIASMWGGPFAIKGIMNSADAERAIEIGASAIVISNHGGRQLDSAAAPIDVLPGIAKTVNKRVEILIDGGIRRGSDIIKAIALGADARLIGRPWVYGLAAKGEEGVGIAIDVLASEVKRNLQLLGCQSIKDLIRKHIALDRELLDEIG